MSSSGRTRGNPLDILRKIDNAIEPVLMVFFYTCRALIISVEVARRYFLGEQTQWGSVVSIYCFIWLSWLGCAYHVKHRTHLRFGELRRRFPRPLKAICYVLDDVIWLVLAWIVVDSAMNLIETQNRLGNVIEGTVSVPLSLATAAVPVGWVLITVRSIQDIFSVIGDLRHGRPLERSLVSAD